MLFLRNSCNNCMKLLQEGHISSQPPYVQLSGWQHQLFLTFRASYWSFSLNKQAQKTLKRIKTCENSRDQKFLLVLPKRALSCCCAIGTCFGLSEEVPNKILSWPLGLQITLFPSDRIFGEFEISQLFQPDKYCFGSLDQHLCKVLSLFFLLVFSQVLTFLLDSCQSLHVQTGFCTKYIFSSKPCKKQYISLFQQLKIVGCDIIQTFLSFSLNCTQSAFCTPCIENAIVKLA